MAGEHSPRRLRSALNLPMLHSWRQWSVSPSVRLLVSSFVRSLNLYKLNLCLNWMYHPQYKICSPNLLSEGKDLQANTIGT